MGSINKYSIILPVKNGGDYIKECVNSILTQTFPGFNLHILDNCSSDGTTSWLDSLSDSRIILIKSNKPLSIEENWGRIKNIPKNEFITLIGHDDILYSSYLETMDGLINLHPDAGLYQTHFNLIDSKGKEIRKCKAMSAKMAPAHFLQNILLNKIDMMGTGFMMRSKDYDKIGGIPDYPNLLFADFEMVCSLVKEKYFAVSEMECFSFRIHQSTTKSSPDTKMQQGFERLVNFLVSLKSADALLNSSINENGIAFVSFYCKGLSHRLLRTHLQKRNGLTVNDFLQKCKSYADLLVAENNYSPTDDWSLRIARILDSNVITRNAFLLFKKVYSKPILK